MEQTEIWIEFKLNILLDNTLARINWKNGKYEKLFLY